MVKSKSVLHKDVIDQVSRIQRADILVGIPSFRNADTIVNVVKNVSDGLTKYFPKLKAVIVNSDGGSRDNTQTAVLNAPIAPSIEKIVTSYQGLPGKGSAFHTIFEIADRLKVKICIVVDSDLRSITPEWIRFLGEPIYKHNFGFVTPYYYRYKYDGTITNSIAYPLTRALYGQMIRQPIGGEFALSGGLAKIFAHQNIWHTDIARFGIDIWMTTTAICEGFRVCQASMGVKLHDQKDPGADLEPMFRQVVGTTFDLMKKYEIKWPEMRGSQPVDLFGESPVEEPEPISVNLERLFQRFQNGVKDCEVSLTKILTPENLTYIQEILATDENDVFHFPDRLWARVVYDHAVAYNLSSHIDRSAVVSALLPLYFGRTAGFVLSTEVMGSIQAEEAVLAAARVFEEEKPYLIKRWEAVTAADDL